MQTHTYSLQNSTSMLFNDFDEDGREKSANEVSKIV